MFSQINLSILFFVLLHKNHPHASFSQDIAEEDEIPAEQVIDEGDASILSGSADTCQTLPTSIHVTKEEHDQSGNVIRSCEGMVVVNKCEGTCMSQLRPSVTTPTGFHKDCVCCRETWMKRREVHLKECYDTDGKLLSGELSSMVIMMPEPQDCSCHKCGS